MHFLQTLNTHYSLTPTQIEFYQKNKFIKLKQVLSSEVVAHFNQVIDAKVRELNKVDAPLEDRSTYGKAFLQLFNLWREDDNIRSLVFSQRIAQIASDLGIRK